MTAACYTWLTESQWREKIARLDSLSAPCRLCPRCCGVDRTAGETGFCGAPGHMVISSIFAHHGEEPPISGSCGSGTVFFAYCTLKCAFCQNYQLSHEHEGSDFPDQTFARRLLWLQEQGCHNINFVTPAHFLPWIVRSLHRASATGLRIPVVYNCGGYESVEALDALDGIVDIYLPDIKYGDNGPAARFSAASDYLERNREAIIAMFRQVGPLKTDGSGIAVRGLCIRHLVLPNRLAGSERVLAWLAQRFDPADIRVSLMAQYHPCYLARRFPELYDSIDPAYYQTVTDSFHQAGFDGFFQDASAIDDRFLIDFRQRKHQPLTGE
jgi:putative pyruvate formate lyase activating enzyme